MVKPHPTLVINEGDATATLQRPNTVVMNLQAAKTRYAMLEGKQHLVVPMVMLTEGVHAGSAGPLFYPNEELAQLPLVWNHKPVVVYHPQINGQGVSACDPIILDKSKIGLILNASFSDGKLKAEAWLDEEKTNRVDDRILPVINSGQMMEISTGLFSDNEISPGEFNGEAYTAVARNYKPDHLAVLPDTVGACSIADGGGLLRTNQNLSHDTLRGLLATALLERFPDDDFFIDAVFDTFIIFLRQGQLWRIFYTSNENEVTLTGEPDEVRQVTEFRTLTGDFVGNENIKENDVNKKLFVLALIANSVWTPDDQAFLMGLDETKLRKMGPTINEDGSVKTEDEIKAETKIDDTDETKIKTEDEIKAETAPTKNTDGKVIKFNKGEQVASAEVTVASYIANAPSQIRDMLSTGLRAHEDQRQTLIAGILCNARNTFTEADLGKMDHGQLQAVAALAGPTTAVNNVSAQPTFAGLADAMQVAPVANQGNGTKVTPLALPSMDFTTK